MKMIRLALAYPFVLIGGVFAAVGAIFVFLAEAVNGGPMFEVKD